MTAQNKLKMIEFNKKERQDNISIIKKRIDILKTSCSSVRTLNGVYVLFCEYGELVIKLESLIANWDFDNRPTINNNKIHFLDFKNYCFVDKSAKKIMLDELSNYDLFKVGLYFEHIVPVPEIKLG